MLYFGGIPEEYSDEKKSKVLLAPVLFDGTSTWGKGASSSLQAFIEASENMELYDIETDSEVYKQGIFTDMPLMGFDSAEKW